MEQSPNLDALTTEKKQFETENASKLTFKQDGYANCINKSAPVD